MWFLPVQRSRSAAGNAGHRAPAAEENSQAPAGGWNAKLYRPPFTIPTTLRIIHPGLTLPIVIPFGWKPAMFTVKCVHNRDMNTETQIAASRSARVDSSKLLSLVQSTTIG
jgi:hypothetical protein